MTVEEVMQYRRAVPFKPFVLTLKDGRKFIVTKPEEISRNSALTWIAVAADADSAEVVDGKRVGAGSPLWKMTTDSQKRLMC